jgi:ketosteroid isomerase-like protein
LTERNLAIVRACFEAYERGDFEAMLADADAGIVTRRQEPDAAEWHGHDGFLQAYADWIEGFDQFSLTLTDAVAPDETHVVARTYQRAVGSESGVPIEGTFWMVFTLAGEKIVLVEIHASEAGAFASVGG